MPSSNFGPRNGPCSLAAPQHTRLVKEPLLDYRRRQYQPGRPYLPSTNHPVERLRNNSRGKLEQTVAPPEPNWTSHDGLDMEGSGVYEIRPSTNKGLGVFARVHLQRGCRIICEHPILTAPREHGILDVNDVYGRFSLLQDGDRETYLRLHATQAMTNFILPTIATCFPQNLREHVANTVSIFETNGFRMESNTETGTSGIFPLAARINHSCSPNASQAWNSRINSLTVHAIRDISIGEEITISYVSSTLDRHQRQSALKGYGFVCGCPACDDSTAAPPCENVSQKRRQQIYRLNEDLSFFVRRNSVAGQRVLGPLNACLVDRYGAEKPLNTIQELVDMLLAESIVGHELLVWYVFEHRPQFLL